MQALLRRRDGRGVRAHVFQCRHQHIARGLDPAAHPAQMGREMALVQKIGQRRFGQGGRKTVGAGAHRQTASSNGSGATR